MASNYTVNKSIEQPLNGSYSDDWDVPVNADWGIIDTAFGGLTTINVTGIAQGVYLLSLAQYQPPNIAFTGTLSGQLIYVVPIGVGGMWSVFNGTTGAFDLQFGSQTGSLLIIPKGSSTLLICDGANVRLADDGTANAAATVAQANAEAFATTAANTAQSNAEGYANSVGTATLAAAETYAATAANAALTEAEAFATTAANTAQSNAETYSNAHALTLFRAGTFNCTNGVVTVTFSTPMASAPIVNVTPYFANPDVGWVVPGSESTTGFQYQNGNAGLCNYQAMIAN